jgi:hypothetical protein
MIFSRMNRGMARRIQTKLAKMVDLWAAKSHTKA